MPVATLMTVAAMQAAVPTAPSAAADPALAADPERAAQARIAAAAMLPPGQLGRMVSDVFGGDLMGSMLDLRPAELFAGTDAPTAKPGAGSDTLRQMLAKNDPAFEERMRITGRVMGEELTKLSPEIEPPLRDGIAAALARRYSAGQLVSINRFFATPDGRQFASQMLTMWVDPAFLKSYFKALPPLIKAMPAIMKKVEAATAGLPKPTPATSTAKMPAPKKVPPPKRR